MKIKILKNLPYWNETGEIEIWDVLETIANPPKSYQENHKDNQNGVWIMGRTEPVKLHSGEYCII